MISNLKKPEFCGFLKDHDKMLAGHIYQRSRYYLHLRSVTKQKKETYIYINV